MPVSVEREAPVNGVFWTVDETTCQGSHDAPAERFNVEQYNLGAGAVVRTLLKRYKRARPADVVRERRHLRPDVVPRRRVTASRLVGRIFSVSVMGLVTFPVDAGGRAGVGGAATAREHMRPRACCNVPAAIRWLMVAD
jgi:hypothetical protein